MTYYDAWMYDEVKKNKLKYGYQKKRQDLSNAGKKWNWLLKDISKSKVEQAQMCYKLRPQDQNQCINSLSL